MAKSAEYLAGLQKAIELVNGLTPKLSPSVAAVSVRAVRILGVQEVVETSGAAMQEAAVRAIQQEING